MINKTFVYEKVIPLIEEKGKRIDVLLLQSLFEDKQQELVDELIANLEEAKEKRPRLLLLPRHRQHLLAQGAARVLRGRTRR